VEIKRFSFILASALQNCPILTEIKLGTRVLKRIQQCQIRSYGCIAAAEYIFLFIYGAGMETSPLSLRSVVGLLYQLWMIDGYDCGTTSRMNEWQSKPKHSGGKTCTSAAQYTTDPKIS
jgi:hypothetical protein